MNTKSLSLGIVLFTLAGAAFSQEFVVAQTQTNSPPPCQENCPQETQAIPNGGQNNMQIDRSGMDKASVHLQVLQQTSQKFTEPSNSKKNTSDDRKPSNKSQNEL